MSQIGLDDLARGELDANNRLIIDIYARQADQYVVYQTDDRVVVGYADDALIQRVQRKRLAPLATLRSEIDGMLATWRERSLRWSRLPSTARQYDMRVYPALVEALEGRADVGQAILAQLKSDIAGEMASRARLAYFMWALASAAALLAACLAIHALIGWSVDVPLIPETDRRLLLAGMCTGILGSLYSIAMRIRQRDLESDLRRLDYATDSFARLGLGAVGAFILGCFLVSGAIEIKFGDGVAPGTGGPEGRNFVYLILIGGFLAGFVERLVPDLLNSYSIKVRPAPEPLPPLAPPAPVAKPATAPADPPDGDAASDEAVLTTPPSDEEHVDGCDAQLDDPALATSDEELPASSGGVAAQ